MRLSLRNSAGEEIECREFLRSASYQQRNVVLAADLDGLRTFVFFRDGEVWKYFGDGSYPFEFTFSRGAIWKEPTLRRFGSSTMESAEIAFNVPADLPEGAKQDE